jgi:hypothetical protein
MNIAVLLLLLSLFVLGGARIMRIQKAEVSKRQ